MTTFALLKKVNGAMDTIPIVMISFLTIPKKNKQYVIITTFVNIAKSYIESRYHSPGSNTDESRTTIKLCCQLSAPSSLSGSLSR